MHTESRHPHVVNIMQKSAADTGTRFGEHTHLS